MVGYSGLGGWRLLGLGRCLLHLGGGRLLGLGRCLLHLRGCGLLGGGLLGLGGGLLHTRRLGNLGLGCGLGFLGGCRLCDGHSSSCGLRRQGRRGLDSWLDRGGLLCLGRSWLLGCWLLSGRLLDGHSLSRTNKAGGGVRYMGAVIMVCCSSRLLMLLSDISPASSHTSCSAPLGPWGQQLSWKASLSSRRERTGNAGVLGSTEQAHWEEGPFCTPECDRPRVRPADPGLLIRFLHALPERGLCSKPSRTLTPVYRYPGPNMLQLRQNGLPSPHSPQFRPQLAHDSCDMREVYTYHIGMANMYM